MSTSDDFIKKYLGATPTVNQKNTAQQPNKTAAGGGVADAFISKYNPSVDESYITKFISDWNDYAKKAETAYKGMNWKSAASGSYDSLTEAGRDLRLRSSMVRSYMNTHKDDFEEDAYKGFMSQLDEMDALQSESGKAFDDAREYFSQWKTEKDYNDYLAYQKDYDEKSKYDIESGQKEIDALEEELRKLRLEKAATGTNRAVGNSYLGSPYAAAQQKEPTYKAVNTDVNARPYAAGRQAYQAEREVDPTDLRISELEKQISQKKQYLNQAKHIQEINAYDDTVKNADFDQYDDYAESDDTLYNWINNPQFRESYEASYQSIPNPNARRSKYTRKGYDRMYASEIAIFNYYYAKSGKEAAQKYLDTIQERLNERVAEDMYGGIKDSTAAKIVFGAAVGLNQFGSDVENFFNTEDDYIAQTAYQLAGGMVREDLADNSIGLWYNIKEKKWEDKILGSSLGQIAYDTISTTANMAPSILASYAVGAAAGTLGLSAKTAQAVGSYTGSAMMGVSAAGGAYQQALNEGYDKNQARGYSMLVGASEMAMEKLLGGISAVGGNALGRNAVKNIANADTALKAIAKRIGGSMISEFGEEYLQEVLEPVFSNIMLKTDKEVKPISAEAIYSGILGMLTGAIMEAPSAIYGETKTAITGRKIKKAGGADSLAKIGNTFAPDTVAYKLAGKVNESTGAYTIGQLLKEVDATLTEQNVSEIAEALMKEGVGEIAAKKYAKAFAYVVEGGAMPDSMVNAIAADTVLAKAAREVLIDSNTTWNQRTQGYNEVLRKLAMDKVTGKKSSKVTPVNDQQMTGKLTAEESTAVENSDESRAETVATPKVSKIQTIENGKTTVKLDDGTEVDLKDADIDPEDSVRIETIANVDGMTAEDASSIYSILKTAGGKSAQMDALGAKEAYQYGYYGLPESQLTDNAAFANSLTETQRKAVYEIGQKARQKKVENTTFKKSGAPKVAGKVHFDGDRSALNERQQVSLKTMDRIAEVLGVQIYVFESKVGKNGKRIGENGWYDPKDGSIHIDLYAGATGEATMLFTLAHELTHYIRQWSPQKFKVLADFLMEEYGKKGVRIESLIREQQNKAKRNGRTISYDTAYEEVVADSMEMMLSDGNVMKRLEKLKAQDKDLWSQIKRFVDNMAAKIREAYKGLKPDSKEAELVKEMGDAIYRLQELFAEGLVEASENFQSAEKNTTDDGGAELYSFRGKNKDGIEVYETSEYVKSLSWKSRKQLFLQLMRNQYRGRTAKFVRNGHVYYATFEYRDVSKNIYGDTESDPKGKDAKVNVGADGNIFELVENSEYFFSEAERGKTQRMHRGVKYWDYFIKTVQIDGNVYDVLAHIRKKDSGSFVYDIEMYENKNIEPSSPEDSSEDGRSRAPNSSKLSIRDDAGKVNEKTAEAVDISYDEASASVAPSVLYSERTWTESDYVQERDAAAKEIAKAIGVSEKKAKDYIDSVNSIAKMIADDRTRLDYFSSPNRSSFVSNVEYGGSFDFSTLCKKRRLLTGTFTAIQKALPNTALTSNEILGIRNRMKDAGLEVSCGLCYVEGSRANMGQFAKEFLRLYKQYYPDAWQPNMADVNTPDGIEWVRINHPECYEQYEYFWNHYGTLKAGDKNLFASQQKPKLYQLHTEYKGEILKKFKDDDNVEEKNLNGGIRLQSFSDFEIVHLIDTMQIIMDMSRVGLAGQAYTKVPDFAWALGDTGLKINLSLIAKGVDENGKLIFDDVEGMPIKDAMNLRDRYSKNVGTILVAFNDEQLKAAMADERVDFIIPFHRSQWKKSQYSAMGLPAKTKDYTFMQNEKFIKPQYHEYRGRMVKDKATNYMPNEYWDFSKSGKENAEAYLKMCARNNKRPKFYKLLQDNGDGSYSLKADGSTDGYWKLLIDFKMYDNAGNGSPQMPVKPEFNMTEATRMLDDYSGGHSNFPVAQGIVDEFVSEYKDSHKGALLSDRDTDGTKFSMRESVEETKDLLAYHNITAKLLLDVLERKGLLMPSLAITNKGMTDFGEISLLFDKSTIDPFISALNKLYGADAWTPTQTQLKKNAKFDTNKTINAVNTIKNSIGTKYISDLFNITAKQFRDTIIKADGSIYDAYAHDIGMQTAYAMERGIISKIPTTKSGTVDKVALQAQLNSEMDTDNGWRQYKRWLNNISDTIITSYDKASNADILRNMKAQPASAKTFKLSENGELVVPAVEYASIDEARRNRNRLSENAAEETKAVADEFIALAKSIGDTKSVVNAINRAFANRYSVADIVKTFNRSGINMSTETARQLQALYKKAVELPTQYFEAKPHREIGLDEIKAVVMPDSADMADVKAKLEEIGISVVVYKAGSKEARVEALNSMENLKFSDRDTESVSNRSLLANAMESLAKTELEKKKLTEYKAKIDQINAEEQKLSEVRAQIKELSFAKGSRDKEKLRALRDEAIKLSHHIGIYDKQLLRMEASKPLQNVLDREKAKAYQRGKEKGEAALEAYKLKTEAKQSESLRDYREAARAANREQRNDFRIMEKEFIRIAKEYEKITAKSSNDSEKGKKTISALREALKDEIKTHKKDQKMWEMEFARLLREYDAADRSITRLEEKIERQRNTARERVENRNKTAMRHKIQNVVKELNSLLLTNDKKRHVPDNLKKAVSAALDLVNMDTVDAENRAAKYADLIAKEQAKANPDQDKIDSYTMTMENILRQGEKMADRIKELHAAYEEIQNSDDPDIANAYDPVIAGAIQELAGTIGNTSIKNMTMEQLSDVYDVYRAVLTRVRDANKAMAENIRASIEELAKSTIREVQTVGGSKKYRVSNLDAVRKFDWNNLKPVYAMERIGSSTLTEVFDNVRAGEDTWAKDVSEAREYYLEKSKKYGYDKWDFDKKYRFESNSGIPFELTLEQILSLYAYSKREQAADHLRLGGFVFDSNIETYKEKDGKKSFLKYKVNTADAHQITPEIMADITGKLSKEQTGFVDEMQDYLSTVMGAKGNEVTSKMYGVKLFKEKFYFPLKSAKQFMFEQNEVSGEVRIKNSGFTNKVVAKANNPVILSNFMDVWSGHVNDMSMYHAFTLPLEDFNRVFNYNSPKRDGVESVSVKGTIQDAYSPAAVSYVKQLITDLNGGARTDSTTGVINKLTGMFKKGAVFASLSVVVQQPSAIARAAALVDTKYFIGPKVDHKRHKYLWSEVKKYAPVAIIKEMGYFDTNMGKSTQDFITGKEYSGIGEKAKALITDSAYRDELLSKAPALADEYAWCGIWAAVKRETKAKYPSMDTTSEAFLKLAGKRFTEVITKTQVYDSVLARSANMRSKDTGMKMATAFMAEPTTSINMIEDAIWKAKRGDKKYAGKAIGAVIASQILNSILVSFVYAGRDDDEDETYAEKYIGALTGSLVDGLNAATYIPFIKDIVSIMQGYDVERSDMAVVSDLWNAWKNMKNDNVSPYRKVENFAGSIAQIFGLPVKNIMRDVRGIYNTITNLAGVEQTTGSGVKYAIIGAITGKTVSDKEQLYKARLDGDKQHAARVAARYDDEDSADAAVRAAIKDSFMADEIDEATALKHMVLYAGMDGSEAHWTMDAWKYRKKVGSDEGYGKYGKFHDAVRSGKNLESVIKEYTDNGVKTSTLTGEITDEFKPVYLEASNSEKAAMKTKLISAYVACDMEREDAEKKLESWDFEAEYGFAYSDRKETYLSGKVSKETLVDILIDRGYDEEDAEAQVEAYEWEASGFEDVTPSAIRNYNEWCEPVGIPKSVYLEFWRFDNSTENDVDKTTGKTIAYSAVKKIMAYINSLNLTDRQKDALAKSAGWADKTIKKYKLW